MPLIYLDAGHGGKDSGAIGNGIKEKDITLDICKRIEKGLKNYKDCEVLMSRTTDEYISLEQRTIKANQANADLLISVHINAASIASAKGFETFIYTNSGAATQAFQNVMHQEILKALGSNIINRGKKRKSLHMVRESKMKAILTENLFITNPGEAALLANDDYLQKIANGHILGLEKFLGLKKTGAQPPPITNKLWTVQVGAFEEKNRAEAVINDLIKLGYKPFLKEE